MFVFSGPINLAGNVLEISSSDTLMTCLDHSIPFVLSIEKTATLSSIFLYLSLMSSFA